jgi:hypothetical protein
MITQEQAKQILVLASKYSDAASANEVIYEKYRHMSKGYEAHEKEAWEKLESYVRALVSEEQQPCTKSTTGNGTSG